MEKKKMYVLDHYLINDDTKVRLMTFINILKESKFLGNFIETVYIDKGNFTYLQMLIYTDIELKNLCKRIRSLVSSEVGDSYHIIASAPTDLNLNFGVNQKHFISKDKIEAFLEAYREATDGEI